MNLTESKPAPTSMRPTVLTMVWTKQGLEAVAASVSKQCPEEPAITAEQVAQCLRELRQNPAPGHVPGNALSQESFVVIGDIRLPTKKNSPAPQHSMPRRPCFELTPEPGLTPAWTELNKNDALYATERAHALIAASRKVF